MQAIGHHGAGGAAASGAHRDAGALGIANEVGHDKEIVGESHFLDHIQLVGQLLTVPGIPLSVPLGKALVAQLAQIRG